jgi:hypothetical protein
MGAGGELLHLSPLHQARQFAQPIFALGQRQADLSAVRPTTRRSRLPTSIVSTSPEPAFGHQLRHPLTVNRTGDPRAIGIVFGMATRHRINPYLDNRPDQEPHRMCSGLQHS